MQLVAVDDEGGVRSDPASSGNLADLLDRVEAYVRRYVVLTDAQAVAVVLWVAHTHAIQAADVTPYLAVTSAEKQSGKTRLLEVVELVARTPIRTTDASEPYVFRRLDSATTTLLIDEADAIFTKKGEREGLRSLLNAGYRRGSKVGRCDKEGGRIVQREYEVFGAKILAGIGQLPDTVADRSIPIRLQRKTRAEAVERFRFRDSMNRATTIRDALAASFDDEAVDELRDARPELPETLDDRSQDGWEPLLAIADLAGGPWPLRARMAAVELHVGSADDESTGVLLLRHVREAFGDEGAISTASLLEQLCEREDGPWPVWWAKDVEADRTRGPASKLAGMLRRYEVRPTKVGPREHRVNGYRRADFEDAWARYLPRGDSPAPSVRPENGHTDNRRSDGLFDAPADEPNTASDQRVSMCPTFWSDAEGEDRTRDDGHYCDGCGSFVHRSDGDAHRCEASP